MMVLPRLKLRKRINEWWYGATPTVTPIGDGGFSIRYQHRNPPARDRFAAMLQKPIVKWVLGAIGAVGIAVITAVVLKLLGLS